MLFFKNRYLVTGQLIPEVFNVIHDVIDTHLLGIFRASVDGVVQVVLHDTPGRQGVAGVHCNC